MLSPQYLDDLPRKWTGIVSDLEDAIIQDIARRITKANYLTPTAKWQVEKARQLRLSNGEIAKRISQASGLSRKQLAKLFRDACIDSLAEDDKVYRRAGMQPKQYFRSEEFDRVIKAGVKNAQGALKNLTRTTAKTADRAFEKLLDRAYFAMQSGAWPPQKVIADTVRELADKGIEIIAYPPKRDKNGNLIRHVGRADIAVRRALLTGVNQTALQISLDYAKEMGCDLVETTAHGGARPDHAQWQGRIFSLSGKSRKYPDFRRSTGYGSVTGLGGANCRHSFYPYIEGSGRAYSDKYLADLDAKTVEYNGKLYSEYEARQKQRGYERAIRDSKRQIKAIDAAISSTDDPILKLELQPDLQRASTLLKQREARLKDFLAQTRQLRDNSREQVVGFGRSEAQKAIQTTKRRLPNAGSVTIAPEKFTGYALNKNHSHGRDKAIAFERALGYTVDNADDLIKNIRRNVRRYPAEKRPKNQHGQPYQVKMVLTGPNGKRAVVKTGWIIEEGQTQPRLTSAYITKG